MLYMVQDPPYGILEEKGLLNVLNFFSSLFLLRNLKQHVEMESI